MARWWRQAHGRLLSGSSRPAGLGPVSELLRQTQRRLLSTPSTTDVAGTAAAVARAAGLQRQVSKHVRLTRLVSSRNLTPSKPRIVIVGTGWGGYTLCNALDKDKYDVQVISPSNHFLFTPLLPSSVVGTLEFRAIQEPVRTVAGLGGYYQAKASRVDVENRQVYCNEIFHGTEFRVEYDYLIVACGAKTNTFNTPGVGEREGKEVFFLKNLHHARQIRNRILECFERAAIHLTDEQERDRLLSVVVVGGGPTNCELVGELQDFIKHDVAKWYPDLIEHISIHIIERAPRLLTSFDPSISDIVVRKFKKRGIDVRLGVGVTSFESVRSAAVLSDGTEIPVGVMVWSAGLQQVNFVENGLPDVDKGPGNRIVVDDHLRIASNDKLDGRVFALGDCAVNLTEPLAPLAQAAAQQAKYLAKAFNNAPQGAGVTLPPQALDEAMPDPFKYWSIGSLVTFGGWKGAVDMTAVGDQNKSVRLGYLYGIMSFLMWRSAYLLKQNSWSNRFLIVAFWAKSLVFGRDISRF